MKGPQHETEFCVSSEQPSFHGISSKIVNYLSNLDIKALFTF